MKIKQEFKGKIKIEPSDDDLQEFSKLVTIILPITKNNALLNEN